ncbi:N-sulfoglucosamine sulfohydrolase [Ereboglobus sp. PH5-10]|uniref:sulfatase family protein n=1 Tax=Ereboglobus sp. PH5-10 TaxID=2940629 RepID=UPI002405D9B0|nr:sulfatase [Ereboglobus sp. PH5-10]MDF9826502.1 N-sulfoglucosamine sulfohydrolase [Ereboglobus sp. PH5-10]
MKIVKNTAGGVLCAMAAPLLFTSGAVAQPDANKAGRPNILFCIADDASFGHMSAYGCKWVSTPAFDRVAREGVLFMRAYTPNAKCAPSRAAVLTGRNSWQLGAAANHGCYFPAEYRTFMEAISGMGYETGFTGKGWSPGDPGTAEDGTRRQLTGAEYNGVKATPPTKGISPIDYAGNFESFLKSRNPGRPFCFWYGGREPHRKYEYGSGVAVGGKNTAQIDRVPPYWPDTETVRNDMLDYALEVEHFDRHLGRMLEALERAGELENTIIVVTSDNGMPFPRMKGTAYEASVHMPLAICWPRGIKNPGRVSHDYVSFIDFAPTFIEAASGAPQAAIMAPVQGRSLMDIFQNNARGREMLLVGQERHDLGRPNDTGYPIRGLHMDGFLYLKNFEPARWPMCDPVTGYLNTDGGPTKTAILEQNRRGVNHWMWELNFGMRPEEELYDLSTDADCMNNLARAPEHSARLSQMKECLFAELRRQNDPRMEGRGDVFDQYPYASKNRNLYNRFMNKNERAKIRTSWVEQSDFEAPDFDPERPLKR